MRTFEKLNKKQPNPKKCKACETEFSPINSLQQVCSVKCSIQLANERAEAKINKERRKAASEWNKEKAELKITTHAKENKKALQDNINLLSRMIDRSFGFDTCIDCDTPMQKQVHGCHYHDVGGNSTLRYNLHNIHSGTSQCNRFNPEHHTGYGLGLIKRYGRDYYDMVEGLVAQYKEIHLNSQDIADKLKIVRKIIRDFNTFKFENATQARTQLNLIIGIYK